jgi:hypothetical protein
MLQARHPAELFIRIWEIAARWNDVHLNAALALNAHRDLRAAILDALDKDDAETATQAALRAARLPADALADPDYRRRLGALMLSIDAVYERIHPRTVLLGTRGRRPYLSKWLQASRKARTKTGSYASTAQHALIARGALSRMQRGCTADGGTSLSAVFAALALVKTQYEHGQLPITVSHRYIPAHDYEGVKRMSDPTKIGHEAVAFLPLARKRAEIAVKAFEDAHGTSFVTCEPAANFSASAEFAAGLDDLAAPVDIAVAPEFVVSAEESKKMLAGLRSRPVAAFRLALLGTGPSEQKSDTAPHDWNHAVLANGKGVELWFQRKIWPALVTGDAQCETFGIPTKTSPDNYQEYNASSTEIVVADIEELGRVVVLICQDIKGKTFARSVIAAFEPDWVFVPILDGGIADGRWMHRECFNISESVSSRFLVVSSLGLARREAHFGLALGPSAAGADDKDRAVLFVPDTPVAADASPRVGVAYWRDDARSPWKQTFVKSQ